MIFSSPIFLFLFLPVVITVYHVLPNLRARNHWLLLMSLAFYAWGEPGFLVLLLASTLMNHAQGLWVARSEKHRKLTVAVAVTFNVGLLAFFKYTNFLVTSIDSFLGSVGVTPLKPSHIALPIGISFFTFHAISYIVDIYRRKAAPAKDPRDVALYIFFFPQLVAGPILRWSAIGPQIARRVVARDDFAEGIRRFIYGLAKKMLIANAVAAPASKIFSIPSQELSPALAWFGTLCYALQIYYDFSGYSDMAVGLGKMFGFEFLENLKSPYIAQSIKEFWRRWHISLSTWFRDYLYVPLGGNRCSTARNSFNLLVVFFLCGLWHGASWTFVIWGLYHGAFLVLERTRFGAFIESLSRPLRHFYALLVVAVGWVLFRADSFGQAMTFLSLMFGFRHATDMCQLLAMHMTNEVGWAIMLGIVFSMPVRPWFDRVCSKILPALPGALGSATRLAGLVVEPVLLTTLLILSAVWLAAGTYNPFIYFRF